MSIYGLLHHVKNQRDHVEQNEDTVKPNYRIVITQRGVCNQLFYDEIIQFGNIHNGLVKMNKHNKITGFKWQDDITIYENETYYDVRLTVEKLNSYITKTILVCIK